MISVVYYAEVTPDIAPMAVKLLTGLAAAEAEKHGYTIHPEPEVEDTADGKRILAWAAVVKTGA